jgi:hypothetical protein
MSCWYSVKLSTFRSQDALTRGGPLQKNRMAVQIQPRGQKKDDGVTLHGLGFNNSDQAEVQAATAMQPGRAE